MLPSEETVKILCKNKYDVLDSRLPILAVADETKCIKGLRVEEKLVTVTGPQNYITVSVTNTTQHEIFVQKNQLLQHLQLIDSVPSVPVTPNPATNVTFSKILTSEEQILSFNLCNNNYSSPFIHIEIAVTQKVREKTDLSELNQIIATQKLVEKVKSFSLSNLYDGKLIQP